MRNLKELVREIEKKGYRVINQTTDLVIDINGNGNDYPIKANHYKSILEQFIEIFKNGWNGVYEDEETFYNDMQEIAKNIVLENLEVTYDS
ncbi:AcrIIA4 family anti-CRISPR protein [Listeria monocytogenes]|uniref:AcrIIA4 family anti-CRISPR protein n=1 Tax=Listeria monocytogenes TaxID=1639 RepID=UPI0011EB1AA7|nr:AcrIIA4 family anti-CRISPR protein [Listeria monocytogenes]TYV30997.1 hypothetical protein FZ060_15475 [Listeria monocytogenes]